jgi:hypothetical protein
MSDRDVDTYFRAQHMSVSVSIFGPLDRLRAPLF